MLLNNGTFFGRLRPVMGSAFPMPQLANSAAAQVAENARAFASLASMPGGYQSAARATIPTFKSGGFMAFRWAGDSAAAFALTGAGNLAVTLAGEGFTSIGANMAANMAATLQGELTATFAPSARGNMAVAMDAGARPSAFDIAQEVWQGQAATYTSPGTMGARLNAAGTPGTLLDAMVEGGLTMAQALRILLAHAAGDATGLEGPTATFKSLDGTKDRIVGTYSGGTRNVTGIDGS